MGERPGAKSQDAEIPMEGVTTEELWDGCGAAAGEVVVLAYAIPRENIIPKLRVIVWASASVPVAPMVVVGTETASAAPPPTAVATVPGCVWRIAPTSCGTLMSLPSVTPT
jgi:hypothetical protein